MDQNQENPQSQTPQSRTPQSQTPQPPAPKPPTPRPPETRAPQQAESGRGSVRPAATAGGPSSGTPSAGPTPSGASSGASSSGASSSGAPSGPPQGAPPPAAPPPPGQEPGTADRLSYQLRSLRRSRNERVVAGVCGGVARGLGIDPLLLRVIAVVLTLFGGAGIVLYALGWLLLPVDDGEPSLGTQLTDRRTRRPQSHNALLAVVLVVAVTLGILSAFRRWDGPLLLALATIGFVVYLLREPSPAALAAWPAPTGGAPGGVPGGPSVPTSGATAFAATAPGATAPGATAPGAAPLTGSTGSTASGSTASGSSGSIASGSTAPMPTTPGMPPVTAGAAPPWQGPPGSPPAPPQPPLPPAPPRERSMLGGLTISAMLLALGVLAAVDGSGVGMPDGAYPALALTVVGIGLLVGAWLGRARGLVWFGLVLAVVTLVATVTTPWQDRHNRQGVDLDLRPTSVSELPADAEYSAGQVRYDLTAVPFEGQSARMGAEIGFGEIVVTVPESVDVTVHASTGLGGIDLLNQDTSGGFGAERTITDLGADGAGGGTLELDLQAGFGHLEVRRAAA